MFKKLDIATRKRVEFVNITRDVEKCLADCGVEEGICHLYVPHTTAGITINESADPSVVMDILQALDAIVPESGKYSHLEGNSPAHIKSSLVGHSAMILIHEGKMALGTWQGIFFCEFDGPRSRRIFLKAERG